MPMLDLLTVEDFINFAVEKFDYEKIYFGHGADNSWDEAVYLVLSILNLPIDSGSEVLKIKLSVEEKELLGKAISARINQRIPSSYLTHEAQFAGFSFYVDDRVLIPRSPLAELIKEEFVPWVNPKKVKRILDIGTGSGCIAISSALIFPEAKVDAVDISQEALDVAKINCKRHQVTKRVRLVQSDLFANLGGETYDIIISNPPYVGSSEMETLPEEYRHEPSEGLLAGDKGDEIVVRIIENALDYLNPGGILVVEVGNSAPLIMEKYKKLSFVWLEFAMGEAEVFLLSKGSMPVP